MVRYNASSPHFAKSASGVTQCEGVRPQNFVKIIWCLGAHVMTHRLWSAEQVRGSRCCGTSMANTIRNILITFFTRCAAHLPSEHLTMWYLMHRAREAEAAGQGLPLLALACIFNMWLGFRICIFNMWFASST